jgi:C-terminal processing protease CtpA/Prc
MRNSLILIFIILASFKLDSQERVSMNQLNAVQDFSKIYGVVRFFHPSDESSQLDWDAFSLYTISRILDNNNVNCNFDSLLIELFKPIVPSIGLDSSSYFTFIKFPYKKVWKHNGYGIQGAKSYKSERILLKNEHSFRTPNFQEVRLSSGQILQIPLTVYLDSNLQSIPSNYLKFKALNTALKTIDKRKYNSKVSTNNFIQTWNVLRHFFPYQKEIDIQWDKILKNYLLQSLNDSIEIMHYNTLRRFSSIFQDGHMNVIFNKLKARHAIPISFELYDTLLVVDKIMADTIYSVKIGDIVTKINGRKTNIYIDSIRKYVSGSRQYQNYLISKQISKGIENDEISIELNNKATIRFRYSIKYNNNLWFYQIVDTIMFKRLNKDICYINLNYYKTDSLLKNINLLREFKAIIFDLRGYPQLELDKFLPYLNICNDKNWIVRYDYIQPFAKDYVKVYKSWNLTPIDSPLNSINVLLTDSRSISYAESIATLFKYYGENNYIVGKNTAGANGNVAYVNLLGGFRFMFTGLKVVNPDGTQHFINGVKPDVEIDNSQKRSNSGQDIFIEEAIKFINKKM